MRAPNTINGRTFDLTHMNGFEGKTDANLRAGQVKKAPIKVEFSCHCWSRRPVDGEAIPPSHLVPEGSKHAPRNRIFCESRYELSRALPELVQTLLTNGGNVHKTDFDNILRVDFVVPLVANRPPIEYFVFLKPEKKTPGGAQKHIRLFIESAYPESVMYDKVNYGKPYSFAKVMGEVWEGRYP